MNIKKAAFGAGCFWGVEAAFRKFLDHGVTKTMVGFMGGSVPNPKYLDVVHGKTGHIETTYLEYDEDVISYERLLDIFFQIHDPTQTDGQGNDKGSSYLSAIFTYGHKQEIITKQALLDRAKNYDKPIATKIIMASEFYPADEHHQRYLEKNPAGYCHVNFDAIN